MLPKVNENVVSVKQLGYAQDEEFLGVSSRSKLFAYGTTVVLGGLSDHTNEDKLLGAQVDAKRRLNVKQKTPKEDICITANLHLMVTCR